MPQTQEVWSIFQGWAANTWATMPITMDVWFHRFQGWQTDSWAHVPVVPVGSVWDQTSWVANMWAAGTWADIPGAPRARLSRFYRNYVRPHGMNSDKYRS
jgi:hypothetical protein